MERILRQGQECDRNADGELRYSKCQWMHYNLFLMLNKDQNSDALMFVREMSLTKRCDDFANMEPLRRQIQDFVGKDSHERILNFEATPKDERLALQMVGHYRTWHSSQLWKALSVSNRVYHTLVQAPENTLAILGILGMPYAVYRAVLERQRHKEWFSAAKPK